MRFGINLRGDLAKLSDRELASCFETLLPQREAMYKAVSAFSGNKWIYQAGLGLPFGRGLFHARIFYKIQGFFYGWAPRHPSLYDLYLVDCELKDLRDELRVRVRRQAKYRKPAEAAS